MTDTVANSSVTSNTSATSPAITAKPMLMTAPEGGGSYAKSAIVSQQNNVAKQSAMLASTGGRKRRGTRRGKRGGATGTIELAKMPYTGPSPATGTMSTQSLANQGTVNGVANQRQSAYDACIGQGPSCTAAITASQSGGKKHRSIRWGCMSGGKKRKSRKSKKNRNTRKSKKSRKSRK
jgi:hypothetical protein